MAYSSKYYDPVKAHEYYMKHRKLKGRKRGSTKGMSEEGKAAAAMIKEQIMEEKKEALAKISDEMKDKIKSMREDLKNKLKGLSSEEKERIKAEYKEKIQGIRDEYKEYKKQTREAYNEKYYDEVEAMQSSGDFKGKRKKK